MVKVWAATMEAALTGTSGMFVYCLLSVFRPSSLRGVLSFGCRHGLASRFGCLFFAFEFSI